jgi:hypothetical protein
MPTNNTIKPNKKLSREGLIYALAFVLYAAVVILCFVYAVKFLGKTINAAFSVPETEVIEAKYGQLRLDAYGQVAAKLDLQAPIKSAPEESINEEQQTLPDTNDSATSTIDNIDNITTTTDSTATDTEVMNNTPTTTDTINIETENTTEINANLEIKPTIAVINSTLTAGLASNLRTDLENADLDVARVGNSKPAVDKTIIKVKNSVSANSSYLTEIKKIVSEKYDFVTETLNENSPQDIEIVIGTN